MLVLENFEWKLELQYDRKHDTAYGTQTRIQNLQNPTAMIRIFYLDCSNRFSHTIEKRLYERLMDLTLDNSPNTS